MERPIKFRGRDQNGKFHYGDLNHSDKYVLISNDGKPRIFVDPDSVAQLVGYDANGNEVYEGDALISVDGDYEDTAKLISNVCDSDKLKEA